jgi:Uma2 family endonuclease
MNDTIQPPAQFSGYLLQPAQHFFIGGVSWASYLAIGNALADRPSLRLTYDGGDLEFMVTSSQHEKYKKWLGRYIETLAEEFQLAVAPGGNTTFQREDLAKGLESDDCFWIAHEPHMRAKETWDPAVDPPPDLALEIEVSRTVSNRLEILAKLRVSEVWCFDGDSLRIYVLWPDGTYQLAQRSPTFPTIPIEEIVNFLPPREQSDYLSAVKAFRAWIRQFLPS